jgi:hypothetical protein
MAKAKVPEWKDVTTYSQGEKERIPRIWEVRFGRARLSVHRVHGIDGWYATCLFWDRKSLQSDTVDEAKREAVKLLETELETALNELIELEMATT